MTAKKKEKKIPVKEEDNKKSEKPKDKSTKKRKKGQPDTALKDLETKLEKAEEEAKENYDRVLRVSAEFENYKKRSSRDMEDFRKYANEALITELLSVVDNLERAINSSENGSQAEGGIVEGVQMTLREISSIFTKFSVTQIDAVEKPFDPVFHQAVMQEENDRFPDGTVIKELQKGYTIHDRLLRPAMVIVSKSKSDKNKDKSDIEE